MPTATLQTQLENSASALPTFDYDITIVGGGLVGLTFATALKHLSLRVAVIEARETSIAASKGQAYHVNLLASRIFQGIGVWQKMRPEVNPIEQIRLSDGSSPQVVSFVQPDLQTKALGYVAEHGVLLTALSEFLQECPNVTYLCPVELVETDYQSDAVYLTVRQDGQLQQIKTQLLVAADGARSPIRQNAGIQTIGWQYWQACVVAFIRPEKSHQNTAYERFQPEGPFAILPLPDNLCRIVWTAPKAEAEAILHLEPEQFMQRLQQRYGDQMGKLELVGDRYVFPVQLQHSRQYVQPRLALIGDAAHCCHPVGGQGVNMGFRDAAALAEVLVVAHQRQEDIGSLRVLRRYERWRKLENLTILGFTDVLNRTFSNNWLPLVVARRMGLFVMRHIPFVKVLALKLMVGLLGQKPQLAQLSARSQG